MIKFKQTYKIFNDDFFRILKFVDLFRFYSSIQISSDTALLNYFSNYFSNYFKIYSFKVSILSVQRILIKVSLLANSLLMIYFKI